MRISDEARKCAVSFGVVIPPDALIKFGGTGFIVSLPRDGIQSQFLVTCRHVAKRLQSMGRFVIRANMIAGGAEPFPVNNVHWIYHADQTIDLAAMPFDAIEGFDHAAYGIDNGPDHALDKAQCGDPINIVGLFRLDIDTSRSTQIVHNGHIAVQPDPNNKIPIRDRITGQRIAIEAYLVEAHTFQGLAGSPVFYHRSRANESNVADQGHLPVRAREHLLGLYVGAWNGESGELLAKDKNWKGDQRVPQSMGLVIPTEEIVEMLVQNVACAA